MGWSLTCVAERVRERFKGEVSSTLDQDVHEGVVGDAGVASAKELSDGVGMGEGSHRDAVGAFAHREEFGSDSVVESHGAFSVVISVSRPGWRPSVVLLPTPDGRRKEVVMPDLIPSRMNDLTPSVGGRVSTLIATDRRLGRALTGLERHTIVRAASVQAHAMVQTQKMHEIDHLTREAMSGQAMLNQWAATLAHGDPFLTDDLKFFTDVARIGKGEVIADTISDYCQEGRR